MLNNNGKTIYGNYFGITAFLDCYCSDEESVGYAMLAVGNRKTCSFAYTATCTIINKCK